MTGPEVLPLAADDEPVRYVVIDDEPKYRDGLGGHAGLRLIQVGGYGSVEAFVGLQREACHVVVLDLCLNRQTGDAAILQGVRAIRLLVGEYGQRVLVHTADPRPEPVARCVAAGAVGYVSKYNGDASALARAVDEIGRNGVITTDALHEDLRRLIDQCGDVRLSETVEQTLALLDRGLTDLQIAEERHLSPRTIEDHKSKILAQFGAEMQARRLGFGDLRRELGIEEGDLVNDPAGQRPSKDAIARALAWVRRRRRR